MRNLLVFVGFFFIFGNMDAQRFSLVAEVGGMKAQIDGDKLQGFHYNGYTFGLGTNYAINEQHALSVKTAYYKQGSRRKDPFQPRLREGFQLEVDLNTVALEFGYKYDPKSQPYFMGFGVLRHQLVNLDYFVIDNIVDPEEFRILNAESLSSGYNSVKFFYGVEFFKRFGGYVAFESAFSNLLRSDFDSIRTLAPYSVSAVFTYEIIASKVDPRKVRPGTKTRTRTTRSR